MIIKTKRLSILESQKKLFDKISSKAKKHRITTSNLLRNLVEDYLEIHGEVWDAILASGEDSIIGYQSITLNKNSNCSLCGKTLKKGSQVFIGFFENSPQKIIVCPKCKKKEK